MHLDLVSFLGVFGGVAASVDFHFVLGFEVLKSGEGAHEEKGKHNGFDH